jgi:uncharacterized protein YpmS
MRFGRVIGWEFGVVGADCMNLWKISFFLLAGIVVATIAFIIIYISKPLESVPIPERDFETNRQGTSHLTVSATKEDFEGIANSYIRKATKGEPLPVRMSVGEDILLISELTIFAITLPVVMHFDPIVRADGNLTLKQSSVEIGKLNIPPATVMKILKDTVKLPPWMIVRPKEEELFIDLDALPVTGNLKIRAKKFNLAEDEIILEILIPEE